MRPADALRELEYAGRVMPGTENTLSVGAWDAERMRQAYEMVDASFTNRFIDETIAYPAR